MVKNTILLIDEITVAYASRNRITNFIYKTPYVQMNYCTKVINKNLIVPYFRKKQNPLGGLFSVQSQ